MIFVYKFWNSQVEPLNLKNVHQAFCVFCYIYLYYFHDDEESFHRFFTYEICDFDAKIDILKRKSLTQNYEIPLSWGAVVPWV